MNKEKAEVIENPVMVNLVKLEQSIFNTINDGKLQNDTEAVTNPFIVIPEEFDPSISISFTPDLLEAKNDVSIYDLLMSDISAMTDTKINVILNSILKDSAEQGSISDTVYNMLNNTKALAISTIENELFKSIMDAVYLVFDSVCRDITISCDREDDKIQLLDSITPVTSMEFIFNCIHESLIFSQIPDNYALYNYTFLLRQRILVQLSGFAYATIRDYLYKLNITPYTNYELFNLCYNRILFDYMYVLDNMINVISTCINYKITMCSNNINRIMDAIEKDNRNTEV